jgi:putative transposase
MSNHVHLLVTPSATGRVAATMQDVGRRYVRLFNQIHHRSGTLWEGRYKSSLIDSETYLFTCHRYIELNPVRAGLVNHPLEYRWSSHAHYATGANNSLITRHALFDELAAEPGALQALLREDIKPEVLDRIRKSANRGWALGSECFLDRIELLLGRSARPPKRGRPFRVSDHQEAPPQEMLI